MVPTNDVLGAGLAILGLGFPAGVALLKFVSSRSNGVCSQHSGMLADVKNLRSDIHEIKQDVKTLLTRRRIDREEV